jgi:peptide deformylase
MTTLMHEANGVGLAATQVGVLRRVFVFVEGEEDRVIVNPVVTSSFEGDRGRTTRAVLSLRGVLVSVSVRRR